MEKDKKTEQLPQITPQYAGEDEVIPPITEDPYAGNEDHSQKAGDPTSQESLNSELSDGDGIGNAA
jgi:hypothetical protein